MGKIYIAGLLAAHRQWPKIIDPGPFQNLRTKNMGHPCRHEIIVFQRPLTVQHFDQH
uniref:Uncharacterized protein n=1 Tax=Hyaloperonospora arabidopsidis (strain Emoy2) TaxID=559515 RepID=M4BQL2_HYAAE